MSDQDDSLQADDLPALVATREDWTKRGACRGMTLDVFFTERGESTKQAKALCAECPVVNECLDYALRTGQKFGIWGGTSEKERKRMRRDMRAVGVPVGPPRGMVSKYDTDELVTLARWAIEHGERVAYVVANRYGITERYATHVVSRARRAGHDIPFDYRGVA